jgi:hypothetical protein
MRTARRLALLLIGSLLAVAPSAAQNLLLNGSFENPVYPNPNNFPVPVTSWTTSPDSGFEVWRNLEGPAADGDQHLEIDVNTCNTISQTIPTSSLNDYRISLAFAARNGVADNEIEVLWNGSVIGGATADGTGQNTIAWTYYTFLGHGASGSSTLQIRNIDACDGVGALLDDVSVIDQGPRIPALGPVGFALLGTGLAIAALFVLRRRAG